MTTKEIAGAVGKSERTVHNWASKASEKSARVSEKIAEARAKSKPADYTLEETITIIEAGMGKNAADIFRANAQNAKAMTAIPRDGGDRIDRLECMVEKLCIAVASIPQTIQSITAGQQKQVPFIQDYFTIKGYSSKIGHQITFSEALALGRAAGRLSREKGYEIRKADDEQYGQVNSYYIEVLKEVFTF